MFNLFGKKKTKPEPIAEPEVARKLLSGKGYYFYEWQEGIPESERDTPEHPSRQFCKDLMEMNKQFTRVEIEKMSADLGYSVFERCGGDGCRHRWVHRVIITRY